MDLENPQFTAEASDADITVSAQNRPSVTRTRIVVFIFGIFMIAATLFLLFGLVSNSTRFTKITLYFSNFSFKKLVPVTQEVRLGDKNKLAVVLQKLVDGPVSNATRPTLPAGLAILNSWVSDGVAYVNVGRKIRFELSENADAEIMAVFSIVNSVVDNVSGVSAVQLLVEDVPLRTIRGLSRTLGPLQKREDLVQKNTK